MLSDTTIADVEETLITLLREGLQDLVNNREEIALMSPADATGKQVRLTLFLYAAVESPYLKNEPRQILTPMESHAAPLSLDLYYMMTSYSLEKTANLDERSREAREVLGRAMRVFHDNGNLSGTILQGNLAGTDEELRISLNPITLEDLTRIWSVFPDTPYRTSVSYLVTPARIRSERVSKGQRVITRETGYDEMVPTRRDD